MRKYSNFDIRHPENLQTICKYSKIFKTLYLQRHTKCSTELAKFECQKYFFWDLEVEENGDGPSEMITTHCKLVILAVI